jgi:hypothetical protein
MTRLKPPENGAPVQWRGKIYEIRRDGSVLVPDELARALLAHGFVPWPESEPRPSKQQR